MNKDVTIVLLSHKSEDLIIDFIDEIYNKFRIIIIDNSNDKKLEQKINKEYSSIIIKLIENNGYGAAANYASKLIKTDYFMINNPDIKNLSEKKILEFVSVAKTLENKFSCLGPRFINANAKSLKQSDQNIDIAEMKFLSGACMFFNKKNFDLLGGFDENFFLYFEESDFCLRSHKINKNYQINKIEVNHLNGTSVLIKTNEEKNKLQDLYTWHFIWSKFYYHKKHYSFILAIVYFIPVLLRIIFKIILNILIKNKKIVNKYKMRWSGLISSIKGKKSYKRLH